MQKYQLSLYSSVVVFPVQSFEATFKVINIDFFLLQYYDLVSFVI